jgi:hypothetical protein
VGDSFSMGYFSITILALSFFFQVNNIKSAAADKGYLLYSYLIYFCIFRLSDELADIFWCYSHSGYFIVANEFHTCSSSFLSLQASIFVILTPQLALRFHL